MSATGKAAQIPDALLARAALMATTGPTLPVAMPNRTLDPDAGPFLEVNYFASPPRWEGLSTGVMDQGRLVIGVVWPKGQGIIKACETAELVKAHFAKGLEMVSGETTVRVALQPYAGAPMTLADRTVVAVTVPWTA